MSNRIKSSLGTYCINEGKKLILSEEKYVVDYSRKFYLFDVCPMGAVRMSSSDRWKTNHNHIDPKKRQREVVTRYFDYKDIMRSQANLMKFELGEFLDAVFFIPMPYSWSEKKKERMNGMPCKVRPDGDNYIKGILDTFKKEDGDVWYFKAEKRWAYNGSILIYQ